MEVMLALYRRFSASYSITRTDVKGRNGKTHCNATVGRHINFIRVLRKQFRVTWCALARRKATQKKIVILSMKASIPKV